MNFPQITSEQQLKDKTQYIGLHVGQYYPSVGNEEWVIATWHADEKIFEYLDLGNNCNYEYTDAVFSEFKELYELS